MERMDATNEELEAEEETKKHWVHWMKIIFIVGKIMIVVVMMAIASCVYYSKFKKCTMIPILLTFYSICLVLLIVLDMYKKLIAGFFILIFFSNYFNFVGFYKILDHLPGQAGIQLRDKTRWYFIVMNVLYALTLLLAFIPMFGPECRANKVYPACMNWTANLFIINFIFHCVIKYNKDYFFKPSAASATSEQSQ